MGKPRRLNASREQEFSDEFEAYINSFGLKPKVVGSHVILSTEEDENFRNEKGSMGISTLHSFISKYSSPEIADELIGRSKILQPGRALNSTSPVIRGLVNEIPTILQC